ncbi:Cupin [Pandoravirus macleodensis]|uniref:Cupin n=1 Tax=Pandoravirus macleodensis TaxID=2107707 RepID=A0A2U7UEI5_9VIRU|nr:Cupin [Pandoravirus macleodensis]AVK76847.1 Cupin [Pandoravirus macleodensis]
MAREISRTTTTTTRSVGQVPVAIVGALPADAMAPRAGVFYPSTDAQGGGTLCLTEGPSNEAALTAAAMPFIIPEKTGPDVGDQPPVGYAIGAPAVAAANPYFRRVLYTVPDGGGQLVAMTLRPHENIGLEAHRTVTQTIRVEGGVGTARVGNTTLHVGPGALVVIPPSVLHDVVNVSDVEPLQLTVFYTEALHPPGIVEPLKASGALAECQAEALQQASDDSMDAYTGAQQYYLGNNVNNNNNMNANRNVVGGGPAYAEVPPMAEPAAYGAEAPGAGWRARLGPAGLPWW